MYSDRRIVSSPATKCTGLTAHLSLVEERVRTLMYSRMKLSGYRTERPIFTNRGPVPVSRAFASQERLTRSSRAASVAVSKASGGEEAAAVAIIFASPLRSTWTQLL